MNDAAYGEGFRRQSGSDRVNGWLTVALALLKNALDCCVAPLNGTSTTSVTQMPDTTQTNMTTTAHTSQSYLGSCKQALLAQDTCWQHWAVPRLVHQAQ